MSWYRQRGAFWLPRRIRPWAERMDLHPGELDVRDLGFRWGSLGKNDRLNIHWAAMQLSVSLLDYVIVHELAHIGQPRPHARILGHGQAPPPRLRPRPARTMISARYGRQETASQEDWRQARRRYGNDVPRCASSR